MQLKHIWILNISKVLIQTLSLEIRVDILKSEYSISVIELTPILHFYLLLQSAGINQLLSTQPRISIQYLVSLPCSKLLIV